MERVVRERMSIQDTNAITPQALINIRPVIASIKEFFGSSVISVHGPNKPISRVNSQTKTICIRTVV